MTLPASKGEMLQALADMFVLYARHRSDTCGCGHSAEGCDNPIAGVWIQFDSDGGPDPWLLCAACGRDCTGTGAKVALLCEDAWEDSGPYVGRGASRV